MHIYWYSTWNWNREEQIYFLWQKFRDLGKSRGKEKDGRLFLYILFLLP